MVCYIIAHAKSLVAELLLTEVVVVYGAISIKLHTHFGQRLVATVWTKQLTSSIGGSAKILIIIKCVLQFVFHLLEASFAFQGIRPQLFD